MSRIKNLFPEFYQEKITSASQLKSEETIIVLDTNYLLNVLELPSTIAEKFVDALYKIKNNIYIPYLVALEFNFNKSRIKKINHKKINEYKDRVEGKLNEFILSIETVENISNTDEKESFTSEFINLSEKFKLEFIKELNQKLSEFLIEDKDKIYNKLLSAIGNLIGEKYTIEWIEQAQKEAKERFSKCLPPGYNDETKSEDKDNLRYYNDLIYEKQYGDYIIWKDIIEYSEKKNNKKRVVFITNDGKSKKKNDLFYKVDNLVVGPKMYLMNEIRQKANKEFYIMDNSRFVSLIEELTDADLSEIDKIQERKFRAKLPSEYSKELELSILDIIEKNNNSEESLISISNDGYFEIIDMKELSDIFEFSQEINIEDKIKEITNKKLLKYLDLLRISDNNIIINDKKIFDRRIKRENNEYTNYNPRHRE